MCGIKKCDHVGQGQVSPPEYNPPVTGDQKDHAAKNGPVGLKYEGGIGKSGRRQRHDDGASLHRTAQRFVEKREPTEEERKLACELVWEIMTTSAKAGDYETSMQWLGVAGELFSAFGSREEIETCYELMVKEALDTGHEEDAAYYSALYAMAKGETDDIEKHLQKIPEGYEGREFLSAYVDQMKTFRKLAFTFAAANAIAEADMANISETKESFLGGLFNTNFDGAREAYQAALAGWKTRLESGKFKSTRTILEDVWAKEPLARKGIAMLAGRHDAWREDAPSPSDKLADNLDGGWLYELLGQEDKPSPVNLRKHLAMVTANAENEGMRQAAGVADIYRRHPLFKGEMDSFIKGEFEDPVTFVKVRETLKGFIRPESLVVMLGGFGLARLTTKVIMSRLIPAGTGALPVGARLGVAGGETVLESGAATVYMRLLAQGLTTQKVDWNPKSVLKDWATLAMGIGFARAASIPLKPLGTVIGEGAAFKTIGIATQGSAFYLGNLMAYGLDLRDVSPDFLEEMLTFVQFQAAGRAMGMVTGTLRGLPGDARTAIDAGKKAAKRLRIATKKAIIKKRLEAAAARVAAMPSRARTRRDGFGGAAGDLPKGGRGEGIGRSYPHDPERGRAATEDDIPTGEYERPQELNDGDIAEMLVREDVAAPAPAPTRPVPQAMPALRRPATARPAPTPLPATVVTRVPADPRPQLANRAEAEPARRPEPPTPLPATVVTRLPAAPGPHLVEGAGAESARRPEPPKEPEAKPIEAQIRGEIVKIKSKIIPLRGMTSDMRNSFIVSLADSMEVMARSFRVAPPVAKNGERPIKPLKFIVHIEDGRFRMPLRDPNLPLPSRYEEISSQEAQNDGNYYEVFIRVDHATGKIKGVEVKLVNRFAIRNFRPPQGSEGEGRRISELFNAVDRLPVELFDNLEGWPE